MSSSLEIICNWFIRLFCCLSTDFEEEKSYSFFTNRNKKCPFFSEKAPRGVPSKNNNTQKNKHKKKKEGIDQYKIRLAQHSFNFSLLHPQYYPSQTLWSRRRRCFSDSLSDLTERSDESLVNSVDLETSEEHCTENTCSNQ